MGLDELINKLKLLIKTRHFSEPSVTEFDDRIEVNVPEMNRTCAMKIVQEVTSRYGIKMSFTVLTHNGGKVTKFILYKNVKKVGTL